MLETIKGKYLPIGTVITLKGGLKKLMITGFMITERDEEKIFDYSGCMYPEGMVTMERIILFNHEQIEKVLYMGYIDEEEEKFKQKLNKYSKETLEIIE